MEPNDSRKNERGRENGSAVLLVVLVLALVVRVGVLVVSSQALAADPDGYRGVAANLLEHGCFGAGRRPIATRPPLYPLLVAACLAVDGGSRIMLAALHVVMGVATVWLTFRLAERWGVGRTAGVAALLVAVDPILLAQSTQVMTETMAALLAVVALTALGAAVRRPGPLRAWLAGVCLGLAVLCRPTFLVWAALCLVAMPLVGPAAAETRRGGCGPAAGRQSRPGADWPRRGGMLAACLAGVAVALAPWMLRNAVQLGHPVAGTTHGGYTLLLANNPSFYDYLCRGEWGTVWDAEAFHRWWARRGKASGLTDEVALDRLAYREAMANIGRRPGTFAYACLVRAGRLWGLVPHRPRGAAVPESPRWRAARAAIGLWYVVLFGLAVVGLGRLAGGGVPARILLGGWLWGLLLVGSFTAVHAVYWSNLRMRAPLMPVVCLAAATGLASLGETASRCKSLARK